LAQDRTVAATPQNSTNELTILIYPLAGDPFEVIVGDAGSEDALLEKITRAIDAGGSLHLTGRRGDTDETALVFNVRNIVAVRVLPKAADGEAGQYL
jgi:hypothetical protein